MGKASFYYFYLQTISNIYFPWDNVSQKSKKLKNKIKNQLGTINKIID